MAHSQFFHLSISLLRCSLIHLPSSNSSLAFHGTKLVFLLFSHKLCLTLQFQGLQHARLPYSNSCPSSRWCHPTISSSLIPFSSCRQYFPASGSFPMRRLFASGGQGTGASASVFPKSIQGCFSLGLTDLISLMSKGLKSLLQHHSSKIPVLQCSVFFIVQLSHMTTGKTIALTRQNFFLI